MHVSRKALLQSARMGIHHSREPLPYLRGRENQTASWVILSEDTVTIDGKLGDFSRPVARRKDRPCRGRGLASVAAAGQE